jgi:hypothetical protein
LLFKKQKLGSDQASIIPYIKTCSFAWSPHGHILTFNYNKIDVKSLKPEEKIINNFNNLEDWVKFAKADCRSKFSRTENKLIEDDNEIIITDKLKKIVDWNNMMELEESQILSSVNKIESLPSLFMSNLLSDLQSEHYPSSVIRKDKNSQNIYDMNSSVNNLSSIFNEQQGKEKQNIRKKHNIHIYYLSLENTANRNFIFENLKIKLLSKEYFFGSLNVFEFNLESFETDE